MLEKANIALDLVKGISTEVAKAQDKTATEWNMFCLSRPYSDLFFHGQPSPKLKKNSFKQISQ